MDREAKYPRAKKSLGQHFLTAPGTARKIVSALEVTPSDRILEIGPGRGALTRWIMEAGPAVTVAVERDWELAPALKESWPGLLVVCADALDLPWELLDGWKVVGNLPYNVASPIIWEAAARARGMLRGVFMVPKEVGQRLTAKPGGRDYGALSVWAQCHAQLQPLFSVGPGVFNPPPKVDSMVFRMSPRKEGRPSCPEALSRLLKICFQSRRKQLANILKDWKEKGLKEHADALGVDLSDRPERLRPEQFLGLSHKLFGQERC